MVVQLELGAHSQNSDEEMEVAGMDPSQQPMIAVYDGGDGLE